MFDKTTEQSQEPSWIRTIAIPFAFSGIAPSFLLGAGIIDTQQSAWIYLSVFATVIGVNKILRWKYNEEN
ncbi:MAG: hypothetical protein KUG75_05125 [Pseudomonadales bacterium]|nr:hypothetical protein [Pseudomonadales bacterium]